MKRLTIDQVIEKLEKLRDKYDGEVETNINCIFTEREYYYTNLDTNYELDPEEVSIVTVSLL